MRRIWMLLPLGLGLALLVLSKKGPQGVRSDDLTVTTTAQGEAEVPPEFSAPSPPDSANRTGLGAVSSTLDGPDQPDAPMSEIDMGQLAAPNALIIDENTNRPLAGAVCEVTDSSGVSLLAVTDDKGRLLTQELLLLGNVSLSVLGRSRRNRVRVLDRADEPPIVEFIGPDVREDSIARKTGLQHRASPLASDVWTMAAERWIPLEYVGAPLSIAPVQLVLAHLGDDGLTFTRNADPPSSKGLDESIMRVAEGASPLVVEAFHSYSIGSDDAPQPHPWSREQVDLPMAGRVLTAVQFIEGDVLVASTDANVVPHLYELPLRLEFEPLAEREPREIRRIYGNRMGRWIINHLGLEGRDTGPTAHLSGFVTSESGSFHEPINMIIASQEPRSSAGPTRSFSTAPVEWSLDPNDAWVGHFRLNELPRTLHSVTMRTGRGYVQVGESLQATPPQEIPAGTLLIRDISEFVPVAVRVRAPDGSPATRYAAALESDSLPQRPGTVTFLAEESEGDAPGESSAPKAIPSLVVAPLISRNADFQVRIGSKGYKGQVLHRDQFTFDGKQLIAETQLEPRD